MCLVTVRTLCLGGFVPPCPVTTAGTSTCPRPSSRIIVRRALRLVWQLGEFGRTVDKDLQDVDEWKSDIRRRMLHLIMVW